MTTLRSVPAGQPGASDEYADMAARFDDVPLQDQDGAELDDDRSAALTQNSQDALAVEFVNQFGRQFRWTHGMDWMRDTGEFWTQDDLLRRMDCARHIAREAASHLTGAAARNLAAASTVASILTLARSDPRMALPADQWDSDPMALNTPTGIVDLRTGSMRPRAGDFVTQCARVAPDWMAPCPNWLSFIDQVFEHDEDMIEFMQRLIGYFLTSDRREQRVFFAQGVGANGKSTLFDLVLWIMGSYSLKLPSSVLMTQKNQQHATELAQLRGKRLALSSELEEGAHWAEGRIKELTGDEFLNARVMRGDPFEFRMSQKHLIVGNYKPRLRGGDAALARRFVLIPFTAKFEGAQKDLRMLEKLKAEGPAILAWAIDGAVKWFHAGLQIPSSVTAASSEYMESNDDVRIWLDECCIFDEDASIRAQPLYESFSSWLKARGQFSCSLRVWGDRMSLLPQIVKKHSGGVRYAGIRLTQDEADRMAALRRSFL